MIFWHTWIQGLNFLYDFQILKVVLRNLDEKEMAKVPSSTFVRRVLTESRHILNSQLDEKLAEEEDYTLTTDAATNDGVHFLGSQLRFKDNSRYILGSYKYERFSLYISAI